MAESVQREKHLRNWMSIPTRIHKHDVVHKLKKHYQITECEAIGIWVRVVALFQLYGSLGYLPKHYTPQRINEHLGYLELVETLVWWKALVYREDKYLMLGNPTAYYPIRLKHNARRSTCRDPRPQRCHAVLAEKDPDNWLAYAQKCTPIPRRDVRKQIKPEKLKWKAMFNDFMEKFPGRKGRSVSFQLFVLVVIEISTRLNISIVETTHRLTEQMNKYALHLAMTGHKAMTPEMFLTSMAHKLVETAEQP